MLAPMDESPEWWDDALSRMADRVEGQQRKTNAMRAQLRQLMASARARGFSTYRIAGAANLSQPRVVQILKELRDGQAEET